MGELKKCPFCVELPCNIGDTVYNKCPSRFGGGYRTDVVDKIIINKDGIFLHFEMGLMKNIKCIGSSLLLSEEAAEAWNRRVEE
ncbi:MAG: hypothetical protein ACLSIF_06770 [Faecalimonas umbilicata]|jgi:hypothetical protein